MTTSLKNTDPYQARSFKPSRPLSDVDDTTPGACCETAEKKQKTEHSLFSATFNMPEMPGKENLDNNSSSLGASVDAEKSILFHPESQQDKGVSHLPEEDGDHTSDFMSSDDEKENVETINPVAFVRQGKDSSFLTYNIAFHLFEVPRNILNRQNSYIVIGDIHSNAILRLGYYIKSGILKVTNKDAFFELLEMIKMGLFDKNTEQLFQNAFCIGLQNEYNLSSIIQGDDVSDRTYCDIFCIMIHYMITAVYNINETIIFSNHAQFFILYYLLNKDKQISDDYQFPYHPHSAFSSTISLNDMLNSPNLEQRQFMRDHFIKYTTQYIKNLSLFQLLNKKIMITHGIVSNDIFRGTFEEALEGETPDTEFDLEQKINLINKWFQDSVLNDYTNYSQITSNRKTPVYDAIWSPHYLKRRFSEIILLSKYKIPEGVSYVIHGHSNLIQETLFILKSNSNYLNTLSIEDMNDVIFSFHSEGSKQYYIVVHIMNTLLKTRLLSYREDVSDYNFSDIEQMKYFCNQVSALSNFFPTLILEENDIEKFSTLYEKTKKNLENMGKCANDINKYPHTPEGFRNLFSKIEDFQNILYFHLNEIFIKTNLFKKTIKSLETLNELYQTGDGEFGKSTNDVHGTRLLTTIPYLSSPSDAD